MNKIVFVVLLYTIFLWMDVNGEVFSSTSKLELLLETQKSVVDNLEKNIKHKRSKNRIVKQYLQRFKLEHEMAMTDISRYVENPLNSFRLIKRLTIDYDFIEKIVVEFADFERDKSVTYPSREDLIGAAEGLLRLVAIYDLNITHLTNGIWNVSYSKNGKMYFQVVHPMTISDCYELGKALFAKKYYFPGIEWLKIAQNKYNDYGDNSSNIFPEDKRITQDEINKQLNKGYRSVEKVMLKFSEWYKEIADRMPNIFNINPDVFINYYKEGLQPFQVLEEIKTKERCDVSLGKSQVMDSALVEKNKTYSALCRGQKTNQDRESERLKCYLVHGPHPFLKLAPIKMERLHQTLDVALFYDVITNAEIQTIKTHTLQNLVRAQVSSYSGDSHTNDRICQVAKIGENITAARLKIRLSQLSGMNLDASEQLQVANYGIGGQYSPHYDTWLNESYISKMGSRIATALFYLSDVDQGGATVFPKLGLTVFPVKGAALFWRNLLHSGRRNPLSYHAACPVLIGSKWVVTQWINLRGQELTHPCPKNVKREL